MTNNPTPPVPFAPEREQQIRVNYEEFVEEMAEGPLPHFSTDKARFALVAAYDNDVRDLLAELDRTRALDRQARELVAVQSVEIADLRHRIALLTDDNTSSNKENTALRERLAATHQEVAAVNALVVRVQELEAERRPLPFPANQPGQAMEQYFVLTERFPAMPFLLMWCNEDENQNCDPFWADWDGDCYMPTSHTITHFYPHPRP